MRLKLSSFDDPVSSVFTHYSPGLMSQTSQFHLRLSMILPGGGK